MKKTLLPLCAVTILFLSASLSAAAELPNHDEHKHSAKATTDSTASDILKHHSCAHCGMDRDKFAHSRMLITYTDGTSAGLCSIHCVVTELKATKDKTVKTVEVADLNSKKLIDAEKAIWVIGGSRKGVMTRAAKWAFAKKSDADAFIKKNGGKIATYKEALALAEKD